MKPITTDGEVLIVSKAIHQVIQEFFVKPDIQFDIFVINEPVDANAFPSSSITNNSGKRNSENFSKNSNFEVTPQLEPETLQLLSKFFSQPSNFAYRLSTNQALKSYFEIIKSIIFFIDHCQYFQDIHYNFMLASRFSQNFKFLAYIHNCEFSYLKQNIELFIQHKELSIHKGLIEDFEILLVNEVDFLYLASIEWFTSDACNHPHLKILNIFNKANQKWNKKLTNYKKHQNFHGCELVMMLYERAGGEKWGSYQKDLQTGSIVQFGLAPEVFKLVSVKFNFIPAFQPAKLLKQVSIFQDFNEVTLISVNGTVKHPNVCFEVIRFSDSFKVTSQSTSSFLEVRDIILVTPGELYSPFEKLLLPFDDWTWQLIVVTFLTAFVAIFVINRLPKIFQKLIYGENVTTPVLNVVSSFFGISQVKLPVKNFPRFILTMFVLFCLIFRTCYQSKLFEFMTSEPRRSPPKTVEDLIVRNYTMYAPLYFAADEDLVADEKWPNMKYVNAQEYHDIFETQSQNSSARIALMMQSMILDHYEWSTGTAMNWLQIPDTSVQVSQVGFSFFVNNFFYRGMNDAVQQLIATGIMGKVVGNLVGVKRKFMKMSEPRKFALENLEFGFVIWMWFCGICVIVFLVEISLWSFSKMTEDWVFSNRIGSSKIGQMGQKGKHKNDKKFVTNLKAQQNISNLVMDVVDLEGLK